MTEYDINKLKGCFYGLIVGDAVGTTLEFKKRDSFEPIISRRMDK